MRSHAWMRRFDFDPEAAVRMYWSGVTPVNIGTPVKYFSLEEGGVSHFNYLRDNILLSSMHARLSEDKSQPVEPILIGNAILRPFRAATYLVNLIDLRHLGTENPIPPERVDPGAETRD